MPADEAQVPDIADAEGYPGGLAAASADLAAWWERTAPGVETPADLDAAAAELFGGAAAGAAREVLASWPARIVVYGGQDEVYNHDHAGLSDWERLLIALVLAMVPEEFPEEALAGALVGRRYWLTTSMLRDMRDDTAADKRLYAAIGLYGGSAWWIPLPGAHVPDFRRYKSVRIDGSRSREATQAAVERLAETMRDGLELDFLAISNVAVDLGAGRGDIGRLVLTGCEVRSVQAPSRELGLCRCNGAGLARLVRASAGRVAVMCLVRCDAAGGLPLEIGGRGVRYDQLTLTTCTVTGEVVAGMVRMRHVRYHGSVTAEAASIHDVSGDFRLTAAAVEFTYRPDRWLVEEGVALAARANDIAGRAGSAVVSPRIYGLVGDEAVAGRLDVAGLAAWLLAPPAIAAASYVYDCVLRPGAIDPAAPTTLRRLGSMTEHFGNGVPRPRVVRVASLGGADGDYDVLCLAAWSRLAGIADVGNYRVRTELLVVVGNDHAREAVARRLAGAARGRLAAARVLAVGAGGEDADAAALAAAVGGAVAGAADRARLAALGWLVSPIVPV